MISTLSIYRGKIREDRGTAIRIRNILARLAQNPDLSLTIASWDENYDLDGVTNIRLYNKHVSELLRLIKYINKNHIQVVVGHTVSALWYLLPIKIFTSAKVVLEMHGFIEEEEYLYKNINRFQFYLKKIFFVSNYFFMDTITTCSDTATEYIRRFNKNTTTVYGGVDTSIFYPRENNQLDADHVVIGYAGNSRVWQGLDFLLGAMKAVVSEDKKYRLKILSSEAKWKLPDQYVYFTEVFPPVKNDKVPEFLATCDILVIPRMDNMVNKLSFPSKIMEYLASGKVVVASKTSDCHKIITDGVDGLLFEPGNMNDFLSKIKIASDLVLRKQIESRAYERSEDFTWEKQTAIMVDVIKKICQKKTGRKIH